MAEQEHSDPLLALTERIRAAQLPEQEQRCAIRKAAGATLRDIADAVGVSPMTVLKWERGISRPKSKHAIAYRQTLDALKEATAS